MGGASGAPPFLLFVGATFPIAALKDEKRIFVVENLKDGHQSLDRSVAFLRWNPWVEGELWRIVKWTDRIECELVASYGTDADHSVVSPDSKPSKNTGIAGSTDIAAVSSQGPVLVTVTQYH